MSGIGFLVKEELKKIKILNDKNSQINDDCRQFKKFLTALKQENFKNNIYQEVN